MQILDGLKFQLHKQYSAFMKHHPHFLLNGGTVSIIGHSLGSVITYDLLLHTAECMGVDLTSGETPTSPSNSPSLSKSTMAVASSFSRPSENGPKAVQLGDRKAGGGGGGGGVRFDPSVASPEASLRLDGDEEEPMVIGEGEPGVCVRAYVCVCVCVHVRMHASLSAAMGDFVCLKSPSNSMF